MDKSTVMVCGRTSKAIVTSDSGFQTQHMAMAYMNGVTVIGMRVSGGIH